MELQTAIPPEHEIATRSELVRTEIGNLHVSDLETANQAGLYLGVIGDLRKKISETFDPIINAAHLTHRKAIEKKKQFDTPLETAERTLKSQLASWKIAEDRRRERARLEREAEARRQHEDLVVQVAAEVEKTDGTAAAEVILQDADNVPPVVAEKQVVMGAKFTAVWKAEVVDLKALIKAVAEGKVPLAALQVNLSFLGSQARTLKGEMNYPGVRVYEDRQVGRR